MEIIRSTPWPLVHEISATFMLPSESYTTAQLYLGFRISGIGGLVDGRVTLSCPLSCTILLKHTVRLNSQHTDRII